MSTLAIQQFKSESSVLSFLKDKLPATQKTQTVFVGTNIKDPDMVQITFPLDVKANDFIKDAPSALGQPDKSLNIALMRQEYPLDQLLSANIVEYVQSAFPASKATPEFQKNILDDFLKFESIYAKNPLRGHQGWTAGWTTEPHDHEAVEGEKARSFVVIRGWDSMADFQACLETPEFKEAIPILFGWGAPHKMWHIQRKD